MMKKLASVVGALAVVLLFGIVDSTVAAEKIRYSGCGIVKKAFMAELAKEFTKTSGVEVQIEGGGATKGIRDVAAGKTVLGGTCRHAIDVPQEQGVKLHHVAWDALVVIVNKDNPVDSVSMDQLKGIIEGKIKDWGDVGGPSGKPIEFYARNSKNAGVSLALREIVFHDGKKEFAATKTFGSTGPLEQAIEKDAWSVGVTGISSARKRNVKILKLNGIDTEKDNIASGKYLLYRPLFLVTKDTPDAQADKFVEFAKSNKGQEIISSQGTVNLKEGGMLWRLYRKQMR